MIYLENDCSKCIHKEMCKYEGNAKHDMEKLMNTTYGTGPNDDYDWNTMSDVNHVTIRFSCKSFREETKVVGIR